MVLFLFWGMKVKVMEKSRNPRKEASLLCLGLGLFSLWLLRGDCVCLRLGDGILPCRLICNQDVSAHSGEGLPLLHYSGFWEVLLSKYFKWMR